MLAALASSAGHCLSACATDAPPVLLPMLLQLLLLLLPCAAVAHLVALRFTPAGAASAYSAPASAAAAVEPPHAGAAGAPLQSSLGTAAAVDATLSGGAPGLPALSASSGGHDVHEDDVWDAVLASAFGAGSAQSGLEACKEGVLPAGNVHTAAAAIADAGAAAPPASPPAAWPAPPLHTSRWAPQQQQQSHAVLHPPAFFAWRARAAACVAAAAAASAAVAAARACWPGAMAAASMAVTAADPGMGAAAVCVQRASCAVRAVRSHACAWQGRCVPAPSTHSACNKMHWNGLGGENAHSLVAPLRPPHVFRPLAFFGLVTSDVALCPGLLFFPHFPVEHACSGLRLTSRNRSFPVLHALPPCILHVELVRCLQPPLGMRDAWRAAPRRSPCGPLQPTAPLQLRRCAHERPRSRDGTCLCSAAALALPPAGRRMQRRLERTPAHHAQRMSVERPTLLLLCTPAFADAPLTRRSALPTAPG
jgi:hypothetical protein